MGIFNIVEQIRGLRPNWNVGILEYWARSEAFALSWVLG